MSSSHAPLPARLLLAVLPMLMVGAAPAAGTLPGTLHVVVDNVRARTGRVHVDLCARTQFLKACPLAADIAAQSGQNAGQSPGQSPGQSTVTFHGVRPGRYAAQVFYDQNGNGKLDRALFGIPKEGVGFSNDAKIRFAPPKWDEAAFDYDGQERTIRLKLRYFVGSDAPVVAPATK